MGQGCRAERTKCATVGPRCCRVAEIAGFVTADAVCRLPLRWFPYYRDYPSQLGRQPVHGGDREYGARQMAAGPAHPDLRLDQWRLQPEHQLAAVCRETP